MALWASASELNYNPAVVSLVSQLFASGSWRKITAFTDVENRFMKLIAEAKNCNALTVYGEYLFQDGKYDKVATMSTRLTTQSQKTGLLMPQLIDKVRKYSHDCKAIR
ncbi:hypothetical protein FOXG_06989 [Fusarium oxysporum f. sp. lycopersici 4287]|uniref:Uncharacterized protein n=2 Tax=Fusarium oxysporum TaxID=5507 RepID=A0A0J9V5V1_FUSO4|nr:hypothetical protein FOXG_06989 [Fusarium oxysporum f. sp. lycopersici 4287]KNB06201.1 hypothetical protein FOXG_06989 [Fusarium oxysporum f. sp. lycopersici 4287]